MFDWNINGNLAATTVEKGGDYYRVLASDSFYSMLLPGKGIINFRGHKNRSEGVTVKAANYLHRNGYRPA